MSWMKTIIKNIIQNKHKLDLDIWVFLANANRWLTVT